MSVDIQILVIILYLFQMGENIGVVVCVMGNFGLLDLWIINFCDGWLNDKVFFMVVGLLVFDVVKVVMDMVEVLIDLMWIYVIMVWLCGMEKFVLMVCQVMVEICQVQMVGEKVGILFGVEKLGLFNEVVVMVDVIIILLVDCSFFLFNFVQMVVVIVYEWIVEEGVFVEFEEVLDLVSCEDFECMFVYFEDELECVGFFYLLEKMVLMMQNLCSVFICGCWIM